MRQGWPKQKAQEAAINAREKWLDDYKHNNTAEQLCEKHRLLEAAVRLGPAV